MGFKRPFDEEEFQEIPVKHPRPVDWCNKLTSFTEIYPCLDSTQKADIPGEGEGIVCKFQSGDGLEYDNRNVVSYVDDKEFEISAPSSWVTSSTGEEDAGSATAICSSLSPEYFEFYLPRRSIVQFGDTYSSLFNGSPRKQIPIGSNHQAEVPVWDPQVMEKYSLGSDHIVDTFGRKLLGDCVFPMPDPELHSAVKAGDGRKDCLCLDQGSIRCVRQHVKEARERIRETFGQEKFAHLGFGDMGEEVSQKWTKEEEWVFHEVVYSNPVSHGKKFWKHLYVVFPTRTKKEIISYYFNVFMLWRRAVQNRSNFLDIDSDDDEWQGSDGGPFRITQEDEDSTIESLVDQGVRVDHEGDYSDDDDDEDDDNDEDGDKGGSDDSDGDAGNEGNTTDNDGGQSLLCKAQICRSLKNCRSEFAVHHVAKILGNDGENFDAQNVPCIVSECQPEIIDSFGSANTRAAVQESEVKGDHKGLLHGHDDGSSDGFGHGYLLDPCDAKVWDARYPMSPFKSVDLLSTGNMIEEIFGPCTRNRKSSDEKSIS